MRFDELPLHEATQRALEAMGFEESTPIQEQTIPHLLEGRDIIAQAQTGTGKTAAFGIPLIEAARNGRRGIVLTPTRELAKQVQRELQAIGKGSPVDVVCLIGGAHFGDPVRALQRHPNAILVATPGRVNDHLQRGTLDLSGMSILVLDEADEMLSMGFQDELDAIVATIPKERQTMLFTATMPPAVAKLAKSGLNDPVQVQAGPKGAANTVEQTFAVVAGRDKPQAVRAIMEMENPAAALLFARTRQRVEELSEVLRPLGAEALHGGMGQPQRDAVMTRFRNGQTRMLIATDVAARGLDVENIELVLHDEPAGDVETYVHRIGRTGRAGRTGKSILFLGPGRLQRLKPIQRVAGQLERYNIPDDNALARVRMDRLMADLQEIEPTPAAEAAMAAAQEAGLSAHDIALRSLTWFLDDSGSEEEEQIEAAQKVALAIKVGKMDDVHPGAIVGALTNAGGLRGEDIGRIDILPKMSVVEVPAQGIDQLCETLQRVKLSGRFLMPRIAEDWRFKAQPRN